MKKGNLEIKEDMDDSFVFRANNYSVYRIGNMQDLKDLRSLIDTVLGEEKQKRWIRCGGKCVCCDLAEPFVTGEFSHPLKEGEGECKRPECYARKAILTKVNPSMEEVIKSTNWREYTKEPQESNKEEKEKHFKGDGCVGHFSDQVKQGEEPVQKLLPKKLNTEVYITDVLDRDLLNKVNEIIEYLKEK